MRAGELRHQVTLERRTAAQDTDGSELNAWTPIGTFDAKVAPVSGRSQFAMHSDAYAVTHEITVRFDPLFADPIDTATLRVRYGTRVFDIHAVLNDEERDRMTTIQAIEGLSRIG